MEHFGPLELKEFSLYFLPEFVAKVAELADALDSKSSPALNRVRVRLPPLALCGATNGHSSFTRDRSLLLVP